MGISKLGGNLFKTQYKRWFLVVILAITSSFSFGQHKILKSKAVPQKADSCHLTVYHVVTKEMSKSPKDIREEKLKQISLSYPDMTTLEKKLSKKPSYTNSRALLTHHNLVFEFYKDGKLNSRVYVSTLTGNINIENFATKAKLHKKISPTFGAYLLWLLDRNKVLKLIPQTNLAGLTSAEKANAK